MLSGLAVFNKFCDISSVSCSASKHLRNVARYIRLFDHTLNILKANICAKTPEKRFEEKGKNLAKEVEKDLGLGNLTSIGGEVFNVPGNVLWVTIL